MLVFYMEEININTLVKTKYNFPVLQFGTKIKVIWLVHAFKKRWQLYWDNLRMTKVMLHETVIRNDDFSRNTAFPYCCDIVSND